MNLNKLRYKKRASTPCAGARGRTICGGGWATRNLGATSSLGRGKSFIAMDTVKVAETMVPQFGHNADCDSHNHSDKGERCHDDDRNQQCPFRHVWVAWSSRVERRRGSRGQKIDEGTLILRDDCCDSAISIRKAQIRKILATIQQRNSQREEYGTKRSIRMEKSSLRRKQV
ncbi:hypothetical protein BLNAU_6693 [Blattamonas nauphoetae]|uniref:Uncharacterized protein n=1 Tax=Blattamonas nauphoetae TaxID=2049346 RepID=A0ABQ9Y3V3_9EUKA|nr:hypothetical protein BLNAU_6693 [Blattamonas nauphoetae]